MKKWFQLASLPRVASASSFAEAMEDGAQPYPGLLSVALPGLGLEKPDGFNRALDD